ncbi:MAG: hypothetical protein WBA39_17850 [Rivularia sp. (in: cyanobacteria)]
MQQRFAIAPTVQSAPLFHLHLLNLDAFALGQAIYQIKDELLSNYLIEQLKRPKIVMSIA